MSENILLKMMINNHNAPLTFEEKIKWAKSLPKISNFKLVTGSAFIRGDLEGIVWNKDNIHVITANMNRAANIIYYVLYIRRKILWWTYLSMETWGAKNLATYIDEIERRKIWDKNVDNF